MRTQPEHTIKLSHTPDDTPTEYAAADTTIWFSDTGETNPRQKDSPSDADGDASAQR